ncbi:ADGRL3 [Branchiostoma lanceolatum]|uniref:ADGRL3 protein n=1 Tax=Branchiostoma lanceolatum TaxID=7740 RepID=A0A8S4MMX3_BRALA|nr:ADGRL3 [Branchiostoma lanceolatum]
MGKERTGRWKMSPKPQPQSCMQAVQDIGRLIVDLKMTTSPGSTLNDQAALFMGALLAPHGDGPRKVAHELSRLNVDIAALSEVRFPEVVSLKEQGAGYTLYWSSKPQSERRLSGVGFMVENTMAAKLENLPTEQPTNNTYRHCEEEMVVTEAVQVIFPRVEGGTFSYSEEHCPSSSANDKPLATRFCRITTDEFAVWDSPVFLSCDITLTNLSQTIEVTEENALTVATELQVITLHPETLSDDVTTISTLMQEIVNVSSTEQIGEAIMTIADNLMRVNRSVLKQSQQEDRGPTRVVLTLETLSDTVELSRESFTSVRPDVALQASDISAEELDKGQDVRLSYILYNNDSLFVQSSQDAVGRPHQDVVGTRIVGSRIAGMQVKNIPEPVVITFTPKEDLLPVEVKEWQYVFWDFEAKAGQGAWSTDGCVNQEVNNGRNQTHHAVSVHARNQRLVLINLCVALLAILIIFLAGIDQTASPIGCTTVTALLHYFLLAALVWMAVEAVNIYLAAVMVFGHYVSESFIYKAAVTAWGLPLIAMLSTVGPSAVYKYRRSNYCWLAELPLTYAFLVPAGLILMFNMVVFSIVMYKLVKGDKEQRALRGAKETKADHQWLIRQLRRAFSMMALFGLTWLFGFFVIDGDSDARTVFAYLFCIFNTLQGLFIFIFHCALREDMRKWWKKLACKGKIKKKQYVLDWKNHDSPTAGQALALAISPDGTFAKLA